MINDVLGYLFLGRDRTTPPRPVYGNSGLYAVLLGGVAWLIFVIWILACLLGG
jgi:hypothetical protein